MSTIKPEGKYIAYDLETSGTSFLDHTILTGYFAIVSEDLTVIDELELKIMPDLSKYKVEQEALDVNGINLEAHMADPETKTTNEASLVLKHFIEKNKPSGRTKLKPLGQNIFFDDMFIFSQLLHQPLWEKSVSYARMDTKVFCDILKEAGMLPADLGSLSSLVEHFGVQRRTAHEAKSDVLMVIDVYGKMVTMLSDLNKGGSIIGSDILSMIER